MIADTGESHGRESAVQSSDRHAACSSHAVTTFLHLSCLHVNSIKVQLCIKAATGCVAFTNDRIVGADREV